MGRDSFRNCAVVDTSLLCAGAQVMATRFDLAGGRNTWTRLVDPTGPESLSSDAGSIIGTGSGRVFAYQVDERQMADGAGPLFTYTVSALAAGTGKVLWRTETADGQTASAPDGVQGGAVAVPEGVITSYGAQGEQYALLDAGTGEVRWKRPEPQGAENCRLRAVTDRAYLICTTGRWEGDTAGTTVSETVEQQGPPAASATHVHFASPSGPGRRPERLHRQDRGHPRRPGRHRRGRQHLRCPLTLVGDALDVPYGDRSVYTLDVRTL
ncbi:PQQ-binding-like beta-propeller repeat protein [Streptomyces paradoxus]|uniref:outer membrane protein assembly factor BamB family protein n=1 Tax=Streptomyces paradoxus TaxID=66375 RepID=UPI0036350DA8